MRKRSPATAADVMPPALERLWNRGAGRRGPKPALSLERIVAAAIELADAEGLPALSMARLAERLGSAPMSLYRHVANKDELQTFMVEAAAGAPPASALGGRGWRSGLEAWAHALRGVYYSHPWILQMTTGRPPLEPSGLAWLDAGLRGLAGTRLAPSRKLSVILLLLNYVRGEAQVATGLLEAHKRTRRERREMQAWYGRMLAKLADAKRFPALAELIAAGVFKPGDDEGTDDFDFGLARLLDGVEAFQRARRSNGRR